MYLSLWYSVSLSLVLGATASPIQACNGKCRAARPNRTQDTVLLQTVYEESIVREDSAMQVGKPEPTVKPTKPTLVNSQNQGQCKDWSLIGGQSYTWWYGKDQRCVHIYVPPRAPKPVPVLLWANCKPKDSNLDDVGEEWAGPDRFGFAVVHITSIDTKKRTWQIPRNAFTSDKQPQKCEKTEPNGKSHIQYIEDVLELLENDRGTYDTGTIVVAGFSKNAKFAAFVGFCFSHKIVGIVQAGGGIITKCSADNSGHKTCTYSPMRPCYEPKNLVTYCGFRYEYDGKAKGMPPMYDLAVKEGYNSQLITFSRGRHTWIQNKFDWIVGCTGMKGVCSRACASDFQRCFMDNLPELLSTSERYLQCMTAHRPESCSEGCAPTLEMLRLSETPKEEQLSRGLFGPDWSSTARPSTSKCVHKE